MDLSVRQPLLSYWLTKSGAGWMVWVWAARSFCMSVSFHNSSAKRGCQASLWFWRFIRSRQLAITTERWGSYFQIPAGQLATTLFWNERDNKTISVNQEHLPIPSSHCHSHCLPLRYAVVLKSPWLILLFFSFLSHFVSQMKHFRFCGGKDLLSYGCTDMNR